MAKFQGLVDWMVRYNFGWIRCFLLYTEKATKYTVQPIFVPLLRWIWETPENYAVTLLLGYEGNDESDERQAWDNSDKKKKALLLPVNTWLYV